MIEQEIDTFENSHVDKALNNKKFLQYSQTNMVENKSGEENLLASLDLDYVPQGTAGFTLARSKNMKKIWNMEAVV